MKTVAVIAEYNPFHRGHAYHIEKIREELGEDSLVIAVMSGNYTQRGDLAIADKFTRAEAAVRCGVNLVLELPFPFSCSSAEFFAESGIKIACAAGADTLSFGSETGEMAPLMEAAQNMRSEKYISALADFEDEAKSGGYSASAFRIYERIFGKKSAAVLLTPNNLLSVEYIKASLKFNIPLSFHTVKRQGLGFNDTVLIDGKLPSAAAIRGLVLGSSYEDALSMLPDESRSVFEMALSNGTFPASIERLSSAILTFFRLNTSPGTDIHDADGGLYNRIQAKSFDATDISSLYSLSATKKYTNARIRRAVWYSLFSVTSSDMRALPIYTQILAFDDRGRMQLKKIRKENNGLYFLTKPADFKFLPEQAARQAELCRRADSVFMLSLPHPAPANTDIRRSPYRKM